MKIEIIVVLIFAVIILALASKEMYDLAPNTMGGSVPYGCTSSPGITDIKWCQATTKAVAEAKCNSLSDCAGYSFFKGDPAKWGNGVATTQLIGVTQLKPIPNVEWDFYKKGAPPPGVIPAPPPGVIPAPPSGTKRAMLNQDQLDRLLRGEQITISY